MRKRAELKREKRKKAEQQLYKEARRTLRELLKTDGNLVQNILGLKPTESEKAREEEELRLIEEARIKEEEELKR